MEQRKAQYRPRKAGVRRVILSTSVLPEAKERIDQLAAEAGQLPCAYVADLIGEHTGMAV